MTNELTLSRFLRQAGAEIRVFDMGRRIGPIDPDTWERFEAATLPYPMPLQRKAWTGLVQIPRNSETDQPAEPVIWFLRLSLDEQGLLVQAERDYLIRRLMESAQAHGSEQAGRDFLADNPYAFQPRQDRMALFHALLSHELSFPASRFYAHAAAYLAGETGWDQWSFVGYQGIADAACRLDDATLADAIPHLPDEPLVALSHCLESRTIADRLRDALVKRLDHAMAQTNGAAGTVAALVRAVAGSASHPETRQAIVRLLKTRVGGDIEVLVAISGRAWELLAEPELQRSFLQRIATNTHGQAAFRQCVDDLLSLPSLAADLRRTLRDEDAPAEIRLAFSRMLQDRDADA
ncbi:MAG: DUF3549 family protein [Gammaproteobacteria bacterium]|nr:DUF3549 family protein [Gammaproteobacteria bacterium]